MQEYLASPLYQFVKEDIKEMRDQRRAYERALERYEAALKSYASLSKLKEASSLREVEFRGLNFLLLDIFI
jgi:hypothetical protein